MAGDKKTETMREDGKRCHRRERNEGKKQQGVRVQVKGFRQRRRQQGERKNEAGR